MNAFVDISAKVTSLPTKGHGYALHLALREAADSEGAIVLSIGPRAEQGSFFEPVLSYASDTPSLVQFLPLPTSFMDSRKITRKIQGLGSPTATLHFYEGGFRELLIASWCLRSNPNFRLIFNFSLVDPWLELLQSRSKLSGLVLKAMAAIIQSVKSRGVFYSESKAMHALLIEKLGIETLTYPLFTLAKPYKVSPADNRADVTFFPMNNHELEFCIDVWRRAEALRGAALDVVFVPKWGYNVSGPALERLTLAGAQVIQHHLSDMEYSQVYALSSVSFLPYFSEYYKYSSSGRALDAASLGSIVFAPRGTATGELVQEKNIGEIFDKEDPDYTSVLLARTLSTSRPLVSFSGSRATDCIASLEDNLKSLEGASPELSAQPRLISIVLASLGVLTTSRTYKASILAQAVGAPAYLRRIVKLALGRTHD